MPVGCRTAAVGLMLFLWVLSFALTLSPELHRLLHRDAQGPSHHCLVTQMQHDSLLAGSSGIPASPTPPLAIGSLHAVEFHFLVSCDHTLSPSRAPPAALRLAVVG
jgi:hypothetical protein